jgi:hypothetical protein
MEMKRDLYGDWDIPLERSAVADISATGVCPKCGHCDRLMAANGEHWAVCDVHRMRWTYDDGPCGGADLDWPHVEARTCEVLACYEKAPHYQKHEPEVTYEIEWALDLVLSYLWDAEAESYGRAMPVERERHILRCLHTLDCWMKAQRPWKTPDTYAYGFHWFSSRGRTMTDTGKTACDLDPDGVVTGTGSDQP